MFLLCIIKLEIYTLAFMFLLLILNNLSLLLITALRFEKSY
jgi:hypothetical protein